MKRDRIVGHNGTDVNYAYAFEHVTGSYADVDEYQLTLGERTLTFDPRHPGDLEQLAELRNALTGVLDSTPTKVVTYEHKPIARTVEIVELPADPGDLTGLTPAWRERLQGLISYTSHSWEDVYHCADCGDNDPTQVGYMLVEATRDEDHVFQWQPTVGVLEAGVLRWLCEECARVPEPASTAQVEQAAKWLASGVTW